MYTFSDRNVFTALKIREKKIAARLGMALLGYDGVYCLPGSSGNYFFGGGES